MSSLRKMAEAKKAAILADAQKRAAEIDREMAELERLTAKYGLSVTEPPQAESPKTVPAAQAITAVMQGVGEVLAAMVNASVTAKAKAVSEAYIRAKNEPVTLGELHEMLERNDIKFAGDTPRNTLSAILGQTPTLYSISRDKGWWLKGVPLPEPPLMIRRRI